MSAPIELPDGLSSRSLTLDDAPAVVDVIAAEEIVDLGEAELTLEDVVVDWQRPQHDLADSTIGVFDGDRLVGYGDVSAGDIAYTAVLRTSRAAASAPPSRTGPRPPRGRPARRSSAARCPRAAPPTG